MTRAEMIEEAAQDVVTILMVDNKCKCLNRLRDAIALPLDSPPSPVATAEAVEMPSENEGWIPVSERLPDTGVWVLARDHPGDYDDVLMWSNRWGGFLDHSENDEVIKGITHWMPIPRPPADQEQEVNG